MKIKIKVKLNDEGIMPKMDEKGDLFDVFSNSDVTLLAPQSGTLYQRDNSKCRDVKFDNGIVELGFAMELPKGFKANLFPRSSTYNKFHIIFGNHVGQIDNSYKGDNDIWKLNVVAFDHTEIKKGDKIAQFEVVPSSRATIWQKLKWLFSSGYELVKVNSLGNKDRGGFGTTGN